MPRLRYERAAKLVWHLADHGTVGLAALLRGLNRPEIVQWFRREHTATDEINRLIHLIGWLLRFPAVWGASEGNNPLDMQRVLSNNGTVWLEMPSQHFEKIEHQVVSYMAEAAVLELLLSKTPVSPLLANVYLDPLDKELERTGIAFARYRRSVTRARRRDRESRLRFTADFAQT